MTEPGAVQLLDSTTILTLPLEGFKLIEASAGTGKTHTITDLYLRHILAGRLTSEILVVTYTNAATEELRGRIHQRLYQVTAALADGSEAGDEFLQGLQRDWQQLDSETQQLQLRRLQLALRSLDEASISTIHSFCHRSLQEQALAGNQLYETELLQDDADLWQAAAKDWWRRQADRLDADGWRLLGEKLGNLQKLIAVLLDLRNKPSARLIPEPGQDLDDMLQYPQVLAGRLKALAPLWQQDRTALRQILITSKALGRSQALPYHPTRITDWLDAADYFFSASEEQRLFADFEFLGSEWLRQHSKPSQRDKDDQLLHEFFKAVNPIARDWADFRESLGPMLQANALESASRQVLKQKRELAALAYQDQLSLLLEALESSRGRLLASSLRLRYPVAMIDEFQDTDAIQYRIFRHIYHSEADCSLTLIGDPKQAIYSFRGGDIFTYMQARQLPGIRHFSLDRNWRSTPDLVKAVNTLFGNREDAFIYRDSIPFHDASANADNARYRLEVADHEAAMVLWQLPQDEAGENHSRARMRELVNHAVVNEISSLLEPRPPETARIDGKAVQSGDIAILVRTANEGLAISRLLHHHGIRTVTIGRDSVFASDEANGLYDLLIAISQHHDPTAATRSLASNLLHLDYLEMAAYVDDDVAWQDWLETLAELKQLWERQGFIAMFQAMLQRLEVHRRLTEHDNSERRLTNLLHLAELLHQQSLKQAGLTPLLTWLQTQFEASSREESELRLEDDSALVKIVTIHKAKGLQYPVVFVPFLWTCKPVNRNQPVAFHDAELNACIDLGSRDHAEHWLIAEKERLAEDLRLLYVALTRARSRVYLAWGLAGSPKRAGYADQTALAYLIHKRQRAESLGSEAVNGFGDNLDFEADLEHLIDGSAGTITRVPLPLADRQLRSNPAPLTSNPPKLAQFHRITETVWRVNSFTALTRGVHQPVNLGSTRRGEDPILDFPAGSHIGLMLHSILENLDFTGNIEQQSESLFRRFVTASGLAGEHADDLLAWLRNILNTPLDGDTLTLSQVSSDKRLNELAFDFSLDRLNIDKLNEFMQARSAAALQPVSGQDFRGMMTGVIDLVFEYRGRYYLADYKSNYLGSALGDYSPEKLQQAMLDRRYDLQSLLYALALHRLLATRLVNYDFERHFGGSYYLFLRAMRPEMTNRCGIHYERPSLQAIEQFDALFEYSANHELSS